MAALGPRIPIIEELTADPIPPRSQLLVEYDPASQWHNATMTIGAGWLRLGGTFSYNLTLQSPDKLRSTLQQFGLDTAKLEAEDKLRIQDYYTATLGKISGERLSRPLKAHDLSLVWARLIHASDEPETHLLRIWDNLSTLGRFNDDKAWVEFVLSREIPLGSSLGATTIHGIVNGVHEGWVYRRLEDSHDGIIDFKLDESGGKARDLIRIRTMRNVHFDREWHQLIVGDNFQVALEK